MVKQSAKVPAKAAARQAQSRSAALVAAASVQTGTVAAVMDQLPGDADDPALSKGEKQTLQSIAHGAEGYGNEYGSGPAEANAEAGNEETASTPRDSASPAASAMTTRRTMPAGQSAGSDKDSGKKPV